MSVESQAFRAAMEDATPAPETPAEAIPLNPTLLIAASGPCVCGCKRPAGILLSMASSRGYVDDPRTVDAIVDALSAHRAELWGPRP